MLVGPIAASADARAVAGVCGLGLRIEGGFGFGGVLPALHTLQTVAEPRASAIPAKGTVELAAIAARGAGLVGAVHATEQSPYSPAGLL